MPNLNITVIEKRMLKHSEAASYTGLPMKYFKQACPVQPTEMYPGKFYFDKHDLDNWIETRKEGTEITSQDAILSKL